MSKRAKKDSELVGKQISIGQLIKQYREKNGITQKTLSDLLGYENPQFVSLIENGHSKVPLNVLGKVIAALEIPEKKIIDCLLQTYEHEIRTEIHSISKRKSS